MFNKNILRGMMVRGRPAHRCECRVPFVVARICTGSQAMVDTWISMRQIRRKSAGYSSQ